MKRLLIFAAILVALLVLLVAGAPLIVSTDLAKERIADQITSWTGRQVSFRGEPSVSLYPYLTVSLDGLTLANPPSDGDQPFMTVDRLMAKLKLWPLLFGRVEVAEFRLVRPRINLRVDADGRPNWLMRRGTVAGEAAAIDPTPPASRPPRPDNVNIRLGRFVVSDGIVVYDDQPAHRRDEARAVDLDVTWPGTLQAASGRGSLIWRNEPVEFNATVNAPLELMAGGASPMRFALTSKPVRISFTGNALRLDNLQVEGDTTLATPSVRRIIEWLGLPMGAGPILGTGSITGKMNWVGPSISFADAEVALDGNTGEGALGVTFRRGRPIFQGTLDFAKLDLSPYVEAAAAGLQAAGPWPIAPVALPMASSCDFDLRISTGEILLGSAELGKAAASVTMKDGRLAIEIGDAEFHGGHVEAQVAGELQDNMLVGTAAAKFDGVPLQQSLAALAGVAPLDGTGSATIAISARGRSWGEFADALAGTAKVSIDNGAVAGIDIAALAGAMKGPGSDAYLPAGGTTAFTTLAATLKLDEGAISTDDLHAEGSGFSVDMAGSASLFSAALDGKGTLRLTGGEPAAIPFLVSGTWLRPMLLPGGDHAVRRSAAELEKAIPAELN